MTVDAEFWHIKKYNLTHVMYINKYSHAQSGKNLPMLTSDATSAGRRFGLDSASIRFTLACLHRAGINQAKQQCRANTGRGEQEEACIVASDQNDESILRERVEICEEEGEDWEEEGEDWEAWEEDSEWEEEEEEEEEEEKEQEEDEVWDEEKQAWADCLEIQGIPHKIYKHFLRAADNLNAVIKRLNGLNGCERLVKALLADQRRRFLLKVAAAHKINIYYALLVCTPPCIPFSCCIRPLVR